MLLEFGMETKRINELVNMQAHDKMNDIDFLQREISKFLKSPKRMWMLKGDAYYDSEQDILLKKRMVITEAGMLAEDMALPNNKLTDNQYAKMVNQKVNYLLSKPITFASEDAKYVDALNDVFNKNMHRTIKNLGKDSYNGGIGWLYPYYNENGEFRIKRFNPWEVLPFWKDEEHTELEFAVRVYDMQGYESGIDVIKTFVEVYDTNGIHHFEWKNGTLIPDVSTYYFELQLDDNVVGYNWNKVPLIPFKANSSETSLLKRCKSLQDGINDMLSGFADVMQENTSGSSILIVKNYGGTDLGEFRRNLMTYKAVKVETVDGADGGIDTLKIEVNADNYNTIMSALKKAVVQNCSGYDIDELKASGSPNEMTIKAVFADIDLDANEIETEYQASIEQLLWFVNQHLAATGVGNFDGAKVNVIFNRDMMVNESAVIADCKSSVGIISNETIVSQHPWVNDVELEMRKLEKEKEEQINIYSDAFQQSTENAQIENIEE